MLERQETKTNAKMELLALVTEMMPAGLPQYQHARYHPPIAQLVKELGHSILTKAVFMLVKDFAASMNVVRNLSEDQAIEIAHLLVAECGTFRLEDYAIMFALAKRGKLVKIMDRVDMEVISKMVEEYDRQSSKAGQEERDRDFVATDGLGPSTRVSDSQTPQDRMGIKVDGLAEGLRMLRGDYLEFREETDKKV